MQEGPCEITCITEHEGFEAWVLHLKLHSSIADNTMVTVLRRNQVSPLIKLGIGTVMIVVLQTVLGSLHIDSSLDGAGDG